MELYQFLVMVFALSDDLLVEILSKLPVES